MAKSDSRNAALLEEILALEGTEEDLELVAGIDSDQEDASNAAPPPSQESFDAKAFKRFYKTLGFDSLTRTDLSSDEGDAPAAAAPAVAAGKPIPAPKAARAKTPPPVVPAAEVPVVAKAPISNSKWLLLPRPVWHDIELPDLPVPPPSFSFNADLSAKLEAQGQALLAQSSDQYAATFDPESLAARKQKNTMGMSNSDKTFFSSILKSGTSSDKVSALTLMAASSPVHCTPYLTQLMAFCSKKSRDQSLKALRSVVDWLNEQGLPSHRKLRWFDDQPMLKQVAYARSKVKSRTDRTVGDEHLILFCFEAWLKRWYLDMLKLLETMSHDPLPFIRTQTLNLLHILLANKPEQEQNLLRLIVNKLGDTHGPTSSATSHHLLQLLQTHPGMGSIVIREVAALVLKPALGKDAKHDHARYYGLITLNQVVLSRDQPEVAAKLLDLYFEVFQDILSRLDKAEETKPAPKDNAKKRKSTNEQTAVREQKEEGESKLLAAVLTGAHRALPFAKEHLSEIASSPRLDALYKLTHIGTFNSSIQALQLLFHMTTSDDGLPDRFYRTLYDCLIDDRLAGSTKFSMYLNLLFKALKSDKSLPRVMAFVKRLVQVMLYQAVPFVVGALHLLGQLWSSTPGLKQWLEQAPVQLVDDAGDALQHVYDGRKREPQFAGADKTCLWEVQTLLKHYHPVVVELATALLQNAFPSDAPELDHFAQSHFLDQFTCRDPKQAIASRGSSVMQPGAPGQDKTGRVSLQRGLANSHASALNSESFWRQEAAKVPADLRFFHTFWTTKNKLRRSRSDRTAQGQAGPARQGAEEGSDSDGFEMAQPAPLASDGSDVDEDEIWQAMKASMPAQGESDDEVDDVSDARDDSLDAAEGAADRAVDDEDDDDLPAFDEDEGDVFGSEEEVELDGAPAGESADQQPAKKRKLRHKDLPTFAAAEDYADMLL